MGAAGFRPDEYGTAPHGPRVRFSAVGEGWGLFKDEWGTWVVSSLVISLCNAVIYGALASVLGRRLPGAGGGFHLVVPPEGRLLDAFVTAVVNGFFLGGMLRMACLQVRGRRPRVSDLFETSGVLRELAVGSILCALICLAAGLLFVFPAFIAAGTLMFTLPLIVDGRLRAVDALGQSWRALKGQWLVATIFHVVVNLLAALGVCFCGVGLLFTMPLYSLSVAVLYRDFFLSKPADPAAKPDVFDADF